MFKVKWEERRGNRADVVRQWDRVPVRWWVGRGIAPLSNTMTLS